MPAALFNIMPYLRRNNFPISQILFKNLKIATNELQANSRDDVLNYIFISLHILFQDLDSYSRYG